jgi:C4-dicarboxylate-specific signal transduction histidine kinase
VFLATAVVEVLVAHWHVEFISPVDLGILIVVLPITVRVVRRFISDARRLSENSGSLAGQVQEQTLWRDRAQVALVESERMAALGRLAAGVGHEINNPLTYLTLSLTEIEEHLVATHAPAPVLAAASHAKDGATRIQNVAERLRGYARRHDERTPLDLRDVVVAAVKVAGPHVVSVARVDFDLQPMPRVLGDESRLIQAVVNLLINAAQAVAARPGAG